MSEVDLDSVVPDDRIEGDDPADTALLREMSAEAKRYLLNQRWCRSLQQSYFGAGIGGVVAVFLFRIDPLGNADEWLWVVVGDLPSAYLVTDQAPTPADALGVYCDLMQDWVNAVLTGAPTEDVFPVDAPKNARHAEMLGKRIELLRRDIIPTLKHPRGR